MTAIRPGAVTPIKPAALAPLTPRAADLLSSHEATPDQAAGAVSEDPTTGLLGPKPAQNPEM